jgi:hypothetical protein
VEKGLLLKQKNYFSDPDSGYRHGNFYICNAGVRFEDLNSHNTHPVSISYLSVDVTPVDSTSDDWLDFVMEGRRLACDQRYRERLRQLKMVFSRGREEKTADGAHIVYLWLVIDRDDMSDSRREHQDSFCNVFVCYNIIIPLQQWR